MNKEFPEEYDVLFGKVSRIVGTSVFVKLENYDKEGIISFSEVAPGRIRNIRDYVVAGQRIICKVIRVNKEKGHIDLSLRRVSQKEKKDITLLEKHEKEVLILLNIIITDKSRLEQVKNNLREIVQLSEISQRIIADSKETSKLLRKAGFNENEASKFIDIVLEKERDKKAIVKAKLNLSSEAPDGIDRIKKIFKEVEDNKARVNYISSPDYMISVEDTNYKDANKKLKAMLDKILARAKQLECKIEIEDK